MTKSDLEALAGKVGIPCTVEDLAVMKENPAFQRFEQGLFDKLNELYELIAFGLYRDPVSGKIQPARQEDTERIRGEITAYRFVLGIPGKIEDEARTNAENPLPLSQDDQEEVDDFVQRRYREDKGE